jgi:SAM-dependent methyltransferase
MSERARAHDETAAAVAAALLRCPDCRGRLEDLACPACRRSYGSPDGIPDLLGTGPIAERCRQVGAYYDRLYETSSDVWREHAGHTDSFTRYVLDLVESRGPGRYLDVGCGEGFFLGGARRMAGFGVDLSRAALARARARSGATVAVAAAERLPFADGAFDVVTSVGAMEHFLDDVAATTEIRRVLGPGGRYVLALLVDVTLADRLALKGREFLWPRPRPVQLARWLLRKARPGAPGHPAPPAPPRQPVQNPYGARQVQALFERCGFQVTRVISRARAPEAPLPGDYMRFYCLDAV